MPRTSFIAVMVLLLFLVPTFGAMADGSFKVILTSPSGRVEEGSTARVEVHSFDSGKYVGPSQVQAFDYSYHPITLTNKATGIWNGTVTAKPNMISANAQYGSNSSSATLYLRTLTKTTAMPKDVVLTPSGSAATSVPRPGDQLVYYIKTYTEGSLADDYSLNVVYQQNGGTEQTLVYSKMDTGIYRTTFTVPQVNRSTSIKITASVTMYGWARLTSSVDIDIDFAQVWFHRQTITETGATFDICVSDIYGKALGGTTVYLNYSYKPTDSLYRQYKNAGKAVTDAGGKAAYTINYSKVEHTVSLSGTAEPSGYFQDFSGDIIVTPSPTTTGQVQPRSPTPFTFDVVYQGDIDTPLVPHKSIMPVFRAYYGTYWPYKPSAPLVNATIYYYAYTYKQIVAYGKLVTDTSGNITMNLDVPDIDDETDDLTIDFACPVVAYSMSWHTETLTISQGSLQDYMEHPEKLKDNNLHITVDRLNVGGKSKVTADYSGATSGTQAFTAWVPGEEDIKDMMAWSDTQPEWQQLNSGNRPSMAKSDKTFTTNIYIPEFMPKGTYTIFVGCIVYEKLDVNNPYKAFHVNYLHIKAGQGATTPGGGILNLGVVAGIDVAILLLLLIIIIVVLVVVAVAVSRRPKRPVMYQQQIAPAQAYQPPPQPAPAPTQQQYVIAQPVAQEHHAVIVPKQEQFASLGPVPAPPTPVAYQQYEAPPPPPTALPHMEPMGATTDTPPPPPPQ